MVTPNDEATPPPDKPQPFVLPSNWRELCPGAQTKVEAYHRQALISRETLIERVSFGASAVDKIRSGKMAPKVWQLRELAWAMGEHSGGCLRRTRRPARRRDPSRGCDCLGSARPRHGGQR